MEHEPAVAHVVEPVPARDQVEFFIGDRVHKVGGDYTFNGTVVASFEKMRKQIRYVVEDDRGILHIFSFKQLAPRWVDQA